MELDFKRMDPRAIAPTRANEWDAGADLYALEDLELRPGEIKCIPTGIHVALAPNEVGLYWDKSGKTWDKKKNRPIGLTILGGCIDGPYRGPLDITVFNANIANTLAMVHAMQSESNRVALHNAMNAAANDVIRIPYGVPVTQFLVTDGIKFPRFKELSPSIFDTLHGNTVRGSKGFGSSDPVVEKCHFIDGPLMGQVVDRVAQERIYTQGHCYVRGPRSPEGHVRYTYSESWSPPSDSAIHGC